MCACTQELSKYFHLPEKAVAKELGICLTSLKKVRQCTLPPPALRFAS